ncbi:rhodanese-like domain-containing protein [Macrococcus armenti]|uniref:rhodanese-like domain-containing protein n=1 Tax=Macrococcus armenti TaxID=2875764 RepID=UPI001CCAE582|nr:rhodanese-like domain-containing protein [Macrococcus armenti]UBH09053.1 rhodanese-like domain-containing protein [Macrococcus armenti]UBH11346.1 rhodanese-like domain-containing protein [Macrococcus armenti]UBH15835.1 rhodanese-like domain-containing protein [Macrococcus armenti]UBH18195.1 rhodanese-like domain-containing protein [Macrococcus armenti]UBH20461.1 rhodanese-like domain-containing protein [Macrococcus armenti]
MNTITVNSLKQLLEQSAEIKLIDVREIEEFEAGHINEAINIPLSELDQHVDKFNKEDDYIIICRSGNRSGMACDYLNQFEINTTNVQGGMIEWTRL